ncbi:MAG: hypothetical protein LBT68_07240 [Spirochaetales bacterium]|nr:hypothetical protein [Spirochaetales bacterium]
MTGKRHFSIYVIILIFLVVGGEGLSALGGQEDELGRARQLIAEKRYNEALLILTEVIRSEPDKTEEAESLIRRIRVYRGTYNDRYEELIHVLYEEQDVARALDIIKELEALDPNPSPAMMAALDKARESAIFIYEQQEYTRVMNDALVLLDQGEYWQASALYENAIGLAREHFDDAGYGEIAENRVNAVIALVKTDAAAFRNARAAQEAALSGLEAAAASGNDAAFQAAAQRYTAAFRSAARMMAVSFEAAAELQEQNALVLPDREERFLGYTARFINGRPNVESPEGIRGAAQRLLDAASRPAVEILRDRAAALLEEGRAAADNWNWDRARGSFAEALRVTGEASLIMNLWYEAFAARGALTSESWKLAAEEAPLFLSLATLRAAAQSRANLVETLASMGGGDVLAFSSLDELRSFRTSLVRLSAPIAAIRNGWRAFSETTAENPLSPPRIQSLSRIYKSDLDVWEERIAGLEVQTVDRMAAMQLAPITEGLASAQSDYSRGTDFTRGMERRIEMSPGEFETRVAYYPVEAMAIFSGLAPRLNALETSARTFLSNYRSEETRFRTYPGIIEKMAEAQNDITEIQRLRSFVVTAVAAAQANVLQAERFRNEGNLRLTETQSSITAGNFEAARRALAAARQSFSNSLALEDDDGLRSQSDARLSVLSTALLEAEDRQVRADVRVLVDQGRSLYNAGRYEEAENALSRAQRRWEVTQTNEEPEIAYWMGFVRAALLASASRAILVTDPLYNEMNQLLNLAREDYSRAQHLAAAGNKRDALGYLANADEKINHVRRSFPNNQVASVLTLRIAFLRDPGGDTAAMFRNMFNTSFAKIGRSNLDATREGYTEIQDLKEINPNYPGINSAINTAEILLGLKPQPPDPRAIAESRRLTQIASGIVSRNETGQFEIAMAQVNEALRLDPNNTDAMRIKSRLGDVGGGGMRTIVLPSAAEEQYRLAQQHFTSQNYFEALAIVQRLLQTQEGRNYPPLQDLLRRIESQI